MSIDEWFYSRRREETKKNIENEKRNCTVVSLKQARIKPKRKTMRMRENVQQKLFLFFSVILTKRKANWPSLGEYDYHVNMFRHDTQESKDQKKN